uniref:Protein kinase domain-containing protein n=1 Tax=Meloidogyne javanica TaxID=6303 RepID=A0A915LL35_MELJA
MLRKLLKGKNKSKSEVVHKASPFNYVHHESYDESEAASNTSSEAATSHGGPTTCPCGKYYRYEFTSELVAYNGGIELNLNVRMEDSIDSGTHGTIYHAILLQQSDICVVVKDMLFQHEYAPYQLKAANNEVSVLKKMAGDQSVIEYYGHNFVEYKDDAEIYGKFSIVLELGGANLKSYIQQNIVNINDEDDKSQFITKVAGGAAHALRRFHKYYGIHMDIKPHNFVISLENNSDSRIIESKLIDFSTSVYMDGKVTRKVDVYSFGVMIYKLLHKLNKDFDKINKNDLKIIKETPFFKARLNHVIKARDFFIMMISTV